jgi:hypothetical protein
LLVPLENEKNMAFTLYGDHHFEKLGGYAPNQLLDGHPHDSLVILQAFAENFTRRSAVWNAQTGKIAWAPADAFMMAWCHDGQEIGVICEQDVPVSTARRNQKPSQREHVYLWKRYAWPSLQLLSSCLLTQSTDALFHLVISPRSDLAACHWESSEQEILSFIVLTPQGDVPLIDLPFSSHEPLIERHAEEKVSGYLFEPFMVTRPVFSPNGRYLIVGWEKKWYWWPGPEEEEWEEGDRSEETVWGEDWKRPKGDCHFGMIAVFDWNTSQIRTILISAPIPPDWVPPPWGHEAAEMRFGAPAFLDNSHFSLQLPTGEQKTYSIPNADEL